MPKTSFMIYYCGPDLDSGSMDVRDLAPALLGVGDLLEESNRLLFGPESKISARVRSFQDGSFGVELEVLQTIREQLFALVNSEGYNAAKSLISFLLDAGKLAGFATISLVALIKFSRGRQPKAIKRLESGQVEYSFEHQTVVVEKQVDILYRSIPVRRNLERVVSPLLSREGVDRIGFGSKSEFVEVIEKEEAPYFAVPLLEESQIDENIRQAVFSIHSLSFKEDNKWRLSDGQSVFYVLISDKDFLARVEASQVSFSKGDLLTVELKTTVYQTATGIKTEYEAIKILNHKSFVPQGQIPLFE